MNRLLALGLGAGVLFAGAVALAQDAKTPAPVAKAAAQPGPGMDTKGFMGQMDQQMKKMQTLHDKMMSAATPEERQKLMDEHRKVMQDGMGMMNQMLQGGQMVGGMGGMVGGTMDTKEKAADGNAQVQMWKKGIDMMAIMQMMMMDQLGMMTGPKSAAPAAKK
jgi:hypothetical protein